MTRKKATNLPVTQSTQPLTVLPAPPPLKLASIEDNRREMARVYRMVKAGLISSQDGARYVFMLTSIARLVEIGQLEERLNRLEARHVEY